MLYLKNSFHSNKRLLIYLLISFAYFIINSTIINLNKNRVPTSKLIVRKPKFENGTLTGSIFKKETLKEYGRASWRVTMSHIGRVRFQGRKVKRKIRNTQINESSMYNFVFLCTINSYKK